MLQTLFASAVSGDGATVPEVEFLPVGLIGGVKLGR